ncbi:MAG: PilZ domain-containing protein [Acidobacteria bacterium]|nr:PilZ domain-containing protein [Acidobacteriota bacterium]
MKKAYDIAAPTKRQWTRLSPENTPSLKGIALTQGNTARVIDISRGGALIETDVRLCPQTKITLKVLLEQGDYRITGSVLRSSIKSLTGTPIYKSAIVFENPLTALDSLEPAKAEVEGALSESCDI